MTLKWRYHSLKKVSKLFKIKINFGEIMGEETLGINYKVLQVVMHIKV
jgi:hypothetical protein